MGADASQLKAISFLCSTSSPSAMASPFPSSSPLKTSPLIRPFLSSTPGATPLIFPLPSHPSIPSGIEHVRHLLSSSTPFFSVSLSLSESARATASTRSATNSRSPSIRRTSSHKLLQFSQELTAEAVARARQFSHDLKAEFKKKLSRRDSSAGAAASAGAAGKSGIESALAARAARRQRAQLDRTKSGAHKALRGLRFISGSRANSWAEVQSSGTTRAESTLRSAFGS